MLQDYIEVRVSGAILYLTPDEYSRGLARGKTAKRQKDSIERGERKIKEYIAKKEWRKQGY